MGGAAHEYSSLELEKEPHQQQSWADDDRCVSLMMWTVLILSAVISAALLFYLLQTDYQVAHYSVAIDYVSGLSPTTNLGQTSTLDLEFNITLRVASQGLWVSRCADLGTYVEVSYRDISLASTAAVPRQICAGPGKAVEEMLVAKGEGVVVPGSMLDSLAMDLRSGLQVFGVTLHGPIPWKKVWSCEPTPVGDTGAMPNDCILMSES